MKKILSAVLLSALCFIPAFAQGKSEEKKKPYTSLTINSDTFFGLTPIAAVGIPLTNNLDLTGYAIFWSGLGNGQATNFGHWTEFGGGVKWTGMDGALKINPQMGILNGTLLSRGNGTGAGAPMFAEGVVPNITIFFEKSNFELELYGGYYIGTRAASGATTTNSGVTTYAQADPDITILGATPEGKAALGSVGLTAANFPNRNAKNNYTHFWAFPGYKITEWLSAGIHWEELRARPSGGVNDYDFTLYKWTGLYTTIKTGTGSLRIAFGDSVANVSTGLRGSDFLTAPGATPEARALAWYNGPRANNLNGSYYRVSYTIEF